MPFRNFGSSFMVSRATRAPLTPMWQRGDWPNLNVQVLKVNENESSKAMPAVEISPVNVKPSAPAELLDTPHPAGSPGGAADLTHWWGAGGEIPSKPRTKAGEGKATTQRLKWALPGNGKM